MGGSDEQWQGWSAHVRRLSEAVPIVGANPGHRDSATAAGPVKERVGRRSSIRRPYPPQREAVVSNHLGDENYQQDQQGEDQDTLDALARRHLIDLASDLGNLLV